MNSSKNGATKFHEDREDLTGEHKWGDAGQVILFFVFIAVWITDSFILKFSIASVGFIPLWLGLIIAMLILGFSFYLARQGLNIVFKTKRDKPEVIREGVFGIVRHPIYLGSILFYVGLVVITFSLASTAVLLIIISFYYFISKYEEKILVERFGEDYKNYKHNVGMLFPIIFLRFVDIKNPSTR